MISKLEMEVADGYEFMMVDVITEDILKQTRCRINGNEPNPEKVYAKGIIDLFLELSKKYRAIDVFNTIEFYERSRREILRYKFFE